MTVHGVGLPGDSGGTAPDSHRLPPLPSQCRGHSTTAALLPTAPSRTPPDGPPLFVMLLSAHWSPGQCAAGRADGTLLPRSGPAVERTRCPPGNRLRVIRPSRAYPGQGPAAPAGHGRKGSELSEDGTTATEAGTEDAVLLFVGGPLDGRVEIRAARHGELLPTITHVHLHDGPKVVHRYDLQLRTPSAAVYHLRPPVRQVARDQSVAD